MAGGAKVNASSLDLRVIDESYGMNADLYQDVLGVPTTATQDEIQMAYFDRRSELFTLLAKIDASVRGPRSASSLASADQQRYLAERKMDSVVIAVRILADPAMRKAYHRIRPERTGIFSAPRGYTMTPEQQQHPGYPSVSRSNSETSETSTRSNGLGRMPRSVTPPETQPLVKSSSSASDSKNWIQSTFSSSLFSSISSSHSKTEDELEEFERDEERNPRRSKRRSNSRGKQQQHQASPSPHRDREADPVPVPPPERTGEKEKKSIWGRKKRKKKTPVKEEPTGISGNESITDTSLTDYEEANYGRRTRDIDSQPTLSMKSSASKMEYQMSRKRVEARSGDRGDIDTVVDDDTITLRDDDTRTYLGDDGETYATMSVFSDQELNQKTVCCDENGVFGCISGSRTFQKLASEVSDACEDTLVSVDQVFNAFTLTDKDIKAVKKKIDKAKRQLDN